MYPSVEAPPGPIPVTKINLFARIVNVFELILLFLLKSSPWISLITLLTCSNACN